MTNTEIKKAIVNEMAAELDEREYCYKKQHLQTIVNKSLENKSDLIDLLSNHPNWNPEKLMIQFDTDIEREISIYEIYNFTDWLRYQVGGSYDWKKYESDQSRQCKICNFITRINAQFFDKSMKDDIDKVNALNENFKLRTNMKASKAIGKICREEGWDKLPEYNKRYAALCDCLNPLKIKRHTVISVNPIDFLLMSNGNSWESCHYIGDYASQAGCYSSGTISYMLDNHSFLFYTVDASYDGNQIEREPKIQRQVFGYNDEVLVQLRLYPQSNDSGAEKVYDNIRAIVQKVIADCLGKSNMWIKSKNDINDVVWHGENATCYPDWESGNPGSGHCCISTHKERENGKENRRIVFGAMPICIWCGDHHCYSNNISCCENYVCSDCGCRIDEDDVIWVNDDPYCEDCVTLCENCNEYVRNRDIHYIDDEYVCDDCLEYSSNYQVCRNCGEIHHVDNMVCTYDGNYYCEYCAEDHTFECPECGHIYDNEDGVYDEDNDCIYCADCYDDIIARRKENLEEFEYEAS